MTGRDIVSTGVILAAGFGSRLAVEKSGDHLKPGVSVLGRPLILWAIDTLQRAGCRRIVIVLGYEADRIRATVNEHYDGTAEIVFAMNERFDLQNGVSVLSAAPYVDGNFILTMADHIVDDEIVARVRTCRPDPGTAHLLVDYKLDSIFDMDDATKVLEKHGRIVSIGKQLTEFNCVDTGVFVCSTALLDSLARRLELHGDVSLSEGVEELAADGCMFTIDVGDGFWQDVDTPDMLEYARSELEKRRSPG